MSATTKAKEKTQPEDDSLKDFVTEDPKKKKKKVEKFKTFSKIVTSIIKSMFFYVAWIDIVD